MRKFRPSPSFLHVVASLSFFRRTWLLPLFIFRRTTRTKRRALWSAFDDLCWMAHDVARNETRLTRPRWNVELSLSCLSCPIQSDDVMFVWITFLYSPFLFRFGYLDNHLISSTNPADRDVQEIFRVTPHHKQVMMFSATLAKEIRVTCKKFMANVCSQIYCFIRYLTISLSPSKYSLTMRRSWPCTACNSTTSSWKKCKRTESWTSFLIHLNSIK